MCVLRKAELSRRNVHDSSGLLTKCLGKNSRAITYVTQWVIWGMPG